MLHCHRRLLLLGALCLFAVANGYSTERVLLDGIAAKVNGEAITVGDVLTAAQRVGRELADQYSGEGLKEKMAVAYTNELNEQIERRLILDAYEKQEGRIPDWAVEQRINEIIHDMFNDDRDALLNALTKDQRTYEEWRQEIRSQLIIASMKQNNIVKHVSIPASEVFEAYRLNQDKYRQPVEVKLKMIVLTKSFESRVGTNQVEQAGTNRVEGAGTNQLEQIATNQLEQIATNRIERVATNAVDQAKDLRRQVLDGADFAELARLHSQGARAGDGGDWGWTKTGDLRAELKQPVEALAPGEVSEPIDTGREIYLAKVEDRRGGETRSFESARQEIEKGLKQAEAERLYQQWIASLKKDAYLEVSDFNPFKNGRYGK